MSPSSSPTLCTCGHVHTLHLARVGECHAQECICTEFIGKPSSPPASEPPPNPRGENPKDRYGSRKVPVLSVVPSSSILYEALAMADGARKYGAFNYRTTRVRAMVYMDACMRHLLAWVDGEHAAKDSSVPHLAHAKACIGIVIDAFENNFLHDDRPPKGSAPEMIEAWTRKSMTEGTSSETAADYAVLIEKLKGDPIHLELDFSAPATLPEVLCPKVGDTFLLDVDDKRFRAAIFAEEPIPPKEEGK